MFVANKPWSSSTDNSGQFTSGELLFWSYKPCSSVSDDAILGRHVPVLSDEKGLASWSPILEAFEKTAHFPGGSILLSFEALPPGQFIPAFPLPLVVDILRRFL
jgi:hypothetical protein